MGSKSREPTKPASIAPKRTAAAPAKTDPKKPSAGPGEPTFRWYQVRKSDRYVSIAREQLGDERRWKELFELNKDKFPEAGAIREGVRIKLPATEVADSRERRR